MIYIVKRPYLRTTGASTSSLPKLSGRCSRHRVDSGGGGGGGLGVGEAGGRTIGSREPGGRSFAESAANSRGPDRRRTTTRKTTITTNGKQQQRQHLRIRGILRQIRRSTKRHSSIDGNSNIRHTESRNITLNSPIARAWLYYLTNYDYNELWAEAHSTFSYHSSTRNTSSTKRILSSRNPLQGYQFQLTAKIFTKPYLSKTSYSFLSKLDI